MVRITHKGDFKKTERFLEKIRQRRIFDALKSYGQKGVEALRNATPIDTGETAASWYYEILVSDKSVTLRFCNSNRVDGVPIALILQYGHATRNGGYVQGRDYINPAIQPLFDKMLDDIWGEVIKE